MNSINAHLYPTPIPKFVGGNGPNYAGIQHKWQEKAGKGKKLLNLNC